MYYLLFISSVLNGLAQIMWKIASRSFDLHGSILNIFLGLLKNYYFIFGGLLYLFSIILWLYILSKVEVSRAYPFLAVAFIVVAIGGYFLGETINTYKIIGIMLIVIGIIFIGKS